MTIVITDGALQSKLAEVTQAELCDAAGKPLGHFMSRQLFYKLLLSLPESHVSETELDRAFHEPGGSSLHEIWSRLQVS